MRQTGNATVLLWLRDAHAMESQSVQMLTSQLPSLIGFPAFHESVKAHAELSREFGIVCRTVVRDPEFMGDTRVTTQVAEFQRLEIGLL
jgi:hypothetical protein